MNIEAHGVFGTLSTVDLSNLDLSTESTISINYPGGHEETLVIGPDLFETPVLAAQSLARSVSQNGVAGTASRILAIQGVLIIQTIANGNKGIEIAVNPALPDGDVITGASENLTRASRLSVYGQTSPTRLSNVNTKVVV